MSAAEKDFDRLALLDSEGWTTIGEVRGLCAELLPGASVRKHLLWRYSVVWQNAAKVRQGKYSKCPGPRAGRFESPRAPYRCARRSLPRRRRIICYRSAGKGPPEIPVR